MHVSMRSSPSAKICRLFAFWGLLPKRKLKKAPVKALFGINSQAYDVLPI